MRIIRIFFSKTGESAYISHLDLQRVMSRSLRRSQLPVWYSLGFNPHIYQSYSLPLSLMHESLCESVDCKTESELEDFSAFLPALNAALPKGIEATRIAFPKYSAADISEAEYTITYPEDAALLEQAAEGYNKLPDAMVIRKTKRSANEVDLKTVIPNLHPVGGSLTLRLPAGSAATYNPELLTNFLEQRFGLPAGKARICRSKIFVQSGAEFE